MLIKAIWNDFLELIFPTCCVVCSQVLVSNETWICTPCRFELPTFTDFQNKDTDLRKVFGTRVPNMEYALAYLKFSKRGKVQAILHHLKYNHSPELGEVLGRWFGQLLFEANFNTVFDLIIPVPLHPSKLKKRGYNQSEVFAKGLSQTLQLPYQNDVLIRTKATETQTKKNRLERLQNVANVFEVVQPQIVQNKHVLVVDDVVTTGATLEACLLALIEAGCAKVSIATIAKAG
ncbi:MAG: phosphoribosyltransferase family protein [Microscillaceae bacterium]|nr:phosphoribosyltransferase family protein [Microscillaceae bacterium]MDW8461963.1 phosphoribosyltransferase family protein [Cytophagales bacterium]